MSTGVVQILQKSLREAQEGLSSTNVKIRKLTGRDPDQSASRPGAAKKFGAGKLRGWPDDRAAGGPPAKRRDPFGGRSRLAGRLGPPPGDQRGRDSDGEGEEPGDQDVTKPVVQSSVVTATAPPRPKQDPAEDKTSKNRNKRMFGFIMGTLQKFKETEEAARVSEKVKRRQEIEEKLQQEQEVEKEESRHQRKELYEQRKAQLLQVAKLESQMATVQMYVEWNDHDQLLCKYIKTKATPPVFYLPTEHTTQSAALLSDTKQQIEAQMLRRQKEVELLLQQNPSGEELEGGEMEEGMGEEEGKGEGLQVSATMRTDRGENNHGKDGTDEESD
ncbi:hypothetical protein EMCRGX_G032354 [Ephydatia muelleri]|eukprot:Em0019g332a